jgi:GGDEF domain-containing protein
MEVEDRDRPRRPHELDTRPDWTAALLQEASRHARYGRPASVALIELHGSLRGDALDRVARRLADLIRSEARETDRAVRVGAASFRMLLPETNARAARHVVARLEQAFVVANAGRPDAAQLRIEVASPTRGGSLEDAILDAERRLGH